MEACLVPPSTKAISMACQVTRMLQDRPPPLRVTPSGDGGIVFERSTGEVFETIEIQEDGSVERATFRNSRLHSRERWLSSPE